MKAAILDTMKKIGSLIQTQDNRITEEPIFIVQQKIRDYGYDSDYSDTYAWINTADDFSEATPSEAEELEFKDRCDAELGDWEKFYYRDRWEFVTACFTEQGCEDYIRINGHNLREPRIYAAGSFRNAEFKAVRNFLVSISEDRQDG